MVAPSIGSAQRYRALGNLHFVFIPTIAASNLTPTRAEIDAGDDITSQVAEWAGFTTTSNKIDTPDLVSTFVSSIPGSQTADDSSVTLYDDLAGSPLVDIFPRDTTGFMLLMDQGDTPTKKMDVYPVQVASLQRVRALDAATMLQVNLTITRAPGEARVIPAAT